MPHISKKKLDKKTAEKLESQILSIISNTGSKTRVHIFQELLTKTEKMMLAKRIGILFLLDKGANLSEVSDLLGVSPSTAERFQNNIEFGKYKKTIGWIHSQRKKGSLENFLKALVSVAFTGKTHTFKSFVDEL